MKPIWHKDPDQAVREKCRYLEQIRKKEGAATYWALVRQVLKTDPWFMMRVALQFAWLDDQLVGHHFIRHIAENWDDDTLTLLPRGHGKTVPMTAITIHRIINDPNTAILMASRVENNAVKFGEMVSQHLLENDFLQRCFGEKYNKDEYKILPSSTSGLRWGQDGYNLPYRRPRVDPTLECISLNSAIAGRHPDWIYLDDLIEAKNNNPEGWQQVKQFINGCKMLIAQKGNFTITGTCWSDGDTVSDIVNGKLHGAGGRKFKVLRMSCYEDDNPLKQPIYPRKKRWNMDVETGFTHESLEAMRAPEHEGGLGIFFDAQMRNNPAPADRADIKVRDIIIYEPPTISKPLPFKLGDVRQVGIEVTGGGRPIFTELEKYIEEFKISMPLTEISNTRTSKKRDRILAALEPITSAGRMRAQQWMIGDESALDNLGYELRRLGAAAHDDIADALHNCVSLSRDIYPKEGQPADIYMAVDLAWTEKERSDWSVCIAIAKDAQKNYWILDYDRFQISNPTGICQRITQFFRKFDNEDSQRVRSHQRFAGT